MAENSVDLSEISTSEPKATYFTSIPKELREKYLDVPAYSVWNFPLGMSVYRDEDYSKQIYKDSQKPYAILLHMDTPSGHEDFSALVASKIGRPFQPYGFERGRPDPILLEPLTEDELKEYNEYISAHSNIEELKIPGLIFPEDLKAAFEEFDNYKESKMVNEEPVKRDGSGKSKIDWIRSRLKKLSS